MIVRSCELNVLYIHIFREIHDVCSRIGRSTWLYTYSINIRILFKEHGAPTFGGRLGLQFPVCSRLQETVWHPWGFILDLWFLYPKKKPSLYPRSKPKFRHLITHRWTRGAHEPESASPPSLFSTSYPATQHNIYPKTSIVLNVLINKFEHHSSCRKNGFQPLSAKHIPKPLSSSKFFSKFWAAPIESIKQVSATQRKIYSKTFIV